MTDDDKNLPARIAKNENTVVGEVVPPQEPPRKGGGALSLKYRTIAEYAARGYSPVMIAKIMRIKASTVREILGRDEKVWEYINQILSDLFREGDMLLVHLYKKALEKLDHEMESSDPEIRQKAIEKVLKQAMASAGKGGDEGGNKTLIAQFFGGAQGSGGAGGIGVESMDDIILRRRKERGLIENGKEEVKDEDDEI